MLYRLVEHYDTNHDYDYNSSNLINSDKNDTDHLSPKECFICLDSNISDETLIKLKNQIYYFKDCTCDGSIHISCLKRWYMVKSNCPICRINIIEIPNFKTRVITYFMTNKVVAFVYLKTNKICIALIDNIILRIIINIIKYLSCFTTFLFFTCIYADIIRELMKKL